jgi:hypothetical protein
MESKKFTMMKTTRTRTRNWMLKKTTSAMGPQAMGVRLLFLLSIILSKDVVNAVVTSRFNVQVGEMMKLEYFRCEKRSKKPVEVPLSEILAYNYFVMNIYIAIHGMISAVAFLHSHTLLQFIFFRIYIFFSLYKIDSQIVAPK